MAPNAQGARFRLPSPGMTRFVSFKKFPGPGEEVTGRRISIATEETTKKAEEISTCFICSVDLGEIFHPPTIKGNDCAKVLKTQWAALG